MGRRHTASALLPALLATGTLVATIVVGLAAAGIASTQGAARWIYLPFVARSEPGTTLPGDETRFGLAFVNSAEKLSGDARIQRGVDAGASWDRFPLYWNYIEKSAGQFDWSKQDAALRANQSRGLKTLAILLGTPAHYYPAGFRAQGEVTMPPIGGGPLREGIGEVTAEGTCAAPGPPAPRSLFEPIFADGSDEPAPGKAINPANPWARFVQQVVTRYKPGGSVGLNVRHWEIWNEEDLCQFWSGTAAEYARLLKVAYLVIKQNDPDATVIWGGLAHYEQGTFLSDLINILKSDPMATRYNGFFDAAGSHQYSNVTHGYNFTLRIRNALAGTPWADKPIWITESGVPVCGSDPGPPCPSPHRATADGQAAYVWQNIAYTRMAGGGPLFHFQLHDDCGNVIDVNSPDAFGLIKNEPTSFCTPRNAEPRLSYTAYRLATTYLSETELLWHDIQEEQVRRVAFYHPGTKERRTLVWAIGADDAIARVPTTGTEARRIALDGSETTVTPSNGEYRIEVPKSTNMPLPGSATYIGGQPYVLIERDTLPPQTTITALPPTSPPTVNIQWEASDLGSGLASVAVWMRQGTGQWEPWLTGQPASGSAPFTGQPGRCYEFGVVAGDRAGNAPASPTKQAATCISTPTPVPTPGATPTPTAGSLELIRNGGFENDAAWTFGANGAATGGYVTSAKHAGTRAARLGIVPPAESIWSYSSVTQTVTIPSGATSVELSLWVQLHTEDEQFSPRSGAPDRGKDSQDVILVDGQGRFVTLWTAAQETGENWQRLTFDLSAYKGQTVQIYVNAFNNGKGGRTWLYLDDVSLAVTQPSG